MSSPYNRRQILKLGSLFATTLGMSSALSSCRQISQLTGREQFAPQPVKVGYLPITDAAPLLAAYDKGFYRAEGLETQPAQRYRSWDAIVQSFINREVNVVHLLMPTTIWVRYGLKIPGKVVAWNHTNGSAITVRPDIERLEELAGQTVAIPSWYSIHNIVLQIMLRERGLVATTKASHLTLDPNEVRLAVLPPPDMLSSMTNGDLAGYIVAEPYNSAAEAQGVGKLLRLTGDIWKDHACCVAFMHEADLVERPQWTQKVVNALVKSQLWSRANRLELANILSIDGGAYMPYPNQVLKRVLASYDHDYYTHNGAILHPQWRSRRIDFQPYPFPSYTASLTQQMKNTFIQDDVAFLDVLVPQTVAQDLVDDSFVTEALAQVGGLQAFGLPLELDRAEKIQV